MVKPVLLALTEINLLDRANRDKWNLLDGTFLRFEILVGLRASTGDPLLLCLFTDNVLELLDLVLESHVSTL